MDYYITCKMTTIKEWQQRREGQYQELEGKTITANM